MQTYKNIKNFKKHQKHYRDKGFVLVKNFFDKKDCIKAAKWLKSKNHNKLEGNKFIFSLFNLCYRCLISAGNIN